VARFAGRRKGLFLVLLIAPFWISFMMRMLAWIDLLQTNGYVNKALTSLHIISSPVNWLGGHSITVILGLVYGSVGAQALIGSQTSGFVWGVPWRVLAAIAVGAVALVLVAALPPARRAVRVTPIEALRIW